MDANGQKQKITTILGYIGYLVDHISSFVAGLKSFSAYTGQVKEPGYNPGEESEPGTENDTAGI